MNKELSLPIETERLYDKIDEVVQQAVTKGDPEIAFSLGKDFLKIERLSGFALGRLAFTLKGRWPEFDNENRFEDVAALYWDVDKVHLDRLIRTTEMLESGDIPESLQGEFEGKSVKDLIVISAAWQSGDIEDEDSWEKLANADDDYEIRDIVRDLRDMPPRKHTLSLWMTRDGDIYCKVGSGEQKFIGNLDIKAAEDDPEIDKAINRILNNARIQAL